MGERIGSTATSAAMALVVGFCAIGLSVDRAAGQARGVIIQIPDDVAPGSARPAPARAPARCGTGTCGARVRGGWHVVPGLGLRLRQEPLACRQHVQPDVPRAVERRPQGRQGCPQAVDPAAVAAVRGGGRRVSLSFAPRLHSAGAAAAPMSFSCRRMRTV